MEVFENEDFPSRHHACFMVVSILSHDRSWPDDFGGTPILGNPLLNQFGAIPKTILTWIHPCLTRNPTAFHLSDGSTDVDGSHWSVYDPAVHVYFKNWNPLRPKIVAFPPTSWWFNVGTIWIIHDNTIKPSGTASRLRICFQTRCSISEYLSKYVQIIPFPSLFRLTEMVTSFQIPKNTRHLWNQPKKIS